MLHSRYNTIRIKLSFVVGLLTAFFSIILVTYFNYKYKQTIIADAIENSVVHAEEYAMQIKSRIEVSMDISRTLANILVEKKGATRNFPIFKSRCELYVNKGC